MEEKEKVMTLPSIIVNPVVNQYPNLTVITKVLEVLASNASNPTYEIPPHAQAAANSAAANAKKALDDLTNFARLLDIPIL